MRGWPNLGNNSRAITASKMVRRTLPALLLAVSVVSAQAQGAETSIVKLPEQIEYKGLPGTLQIATLYGDPAKPGVFVQRIKFPAGLKLHAALSPGFAPHRSRPFGHALLRAWRGLG